MNNTIYYLPGWSGQLKTGLGQGLLSRGFDVTGRETRGAFKDLGFTAQVATVRDDLKTHFWTEDARVVCNSFGGYLFLHAQAELPTYPGKVLLLSPIVGGFADETTGRVFSPPYEDKLMELANSGAFPALDRCEVHTGSEDWQSHPKAVSEFFGLCGIRTEVAEGRGHMLGEEYVGGVLDKWLHE